MASKTPVSILRELCVKQGIEESYSLISSYGPSNDPTFEVSVETNTGLKATGKGKKKKDAQHNAAQALLDLMKPQALVTAGITTRLSAVGGFQSPVVSPFQSPVVSPFQSTMVSPFQSTVVSPFQSPTVPTNYAAALPTERRFENENSVGRLQEYCQARNWANPRYTMVNKAGDAHQPTFTMLCEVGSYKAQGVSRTKQQAKQGAASALYQNLVKGTTSTTQGSVHSPAQSPRAFPPPPAPAPAPAPKMSESEMDVVIEKYALCKPLTNIPQTKPNLKFGAYHTSMQELLSKVRTDLDQQSFTSAVKTLNSIGEILDLRISYHEGRDITSQGTRTEKCFVYAIVTTQPTTVQVGDGDSINVATEQAALNVLEYWQGFLGIFPVMS